jgi:4-amino-4-deoxy-L-arabinose transferase-like glycosyltransferase
MKQPSAFSKIILLVIFLFSFFIYFFKITSVPPSLFSDEVDANYQAFVFNNKATDYFGNRLPIHFHSYSDWRTSFYIYSIAFIQKFIGHVDLAARLPSAIFGSLSVIVFYLILKQLFKGNIWPLIGSITFSITPWLFIYSRVGFEATGMLFFLLLGIYYWIKFIKSDNSNFFILSSIFFIFTVYFYSTAKLFLFFIAVSLLLIWFKKIINIPLKIKFLAVIIIFLASFPFIFDTLKGRAGYRFSYINIFSDPTVSKTVDYNRYQDSVVSFGEGIGLKPTLISKVNHNKVSVWLNAFIKNYASSFSTEFLFLKGDGNLRQGVQSSGNLLIPDLFLIIIGISLVFMGREKNKKFYLFFLLCLVFAPIPFSLTRDSIFPHATRLILMLPFLSLFSILGLKHVFTLSKSKLLIASILIFYIASFSAFLHQYFLHYSNISARDWHYGMKEAVNSSLTTDYKKIYYISTYEPFLPFFLNYSEYLPIDKNKSPAEVITWDNNDFFTGMQADSKYYFGYIEWSKILNNLPENCLFVVPSKDLLKIKTILNDYNKTRDQDINLIEISKTTKKYTEQEEILLFTLKNE